jgi:hypothetical protein
MKKIIIALNVLAIGFSISASSFAFTQSECEAKAVSKDGKPIYGVAKDASIKKCLGDRKSDLGCEAKAVGKDGKTLYGAAKAASIKKCEGGK